MFELVHHSSWDEFLTQDILDELLFISKAIGKEYTPSANNVLRFLKVDLNNVKVIIFGQDPYPSIHNGVKVATGRAFEPNDLISWNQKFRQVSLKNIIRLIYASYFDISNYSDIKSYSDIIKDQSFKIKEPKEWFDSLEKQGVLFINTSFTTIINNKNVHKELWKPFTINLIKYLNKNKNLYWFLWGQNAQEFKEYIDGTIYTCNHPMMCNVKYQNDFLKCKCFKDTMNIIDWLG